MACHAYLGCVVISVGNAALALVTIRSWSRQFSDHVTPAAFLYCYAASGKASKTFDAFKRRVIAASPEERLEFALAGNSVILVDTCL